MDNSGAIVHMMQTRREFLEHAAILVVSAGPAARQRPSVDGRAAGEETTIEGIRLCWCPPGRFVMGIPQAKQVVVPTKSQSTSR